VYKRHDVRVASFSNIGKLIEVSRRHIQTAGGSAISSRLSGIILCFDSIEVCLIICGVIVTTSGFQLATELSLATGQSFEPSVSPALYRLSYLNCAAKLVPGQSVEQTELASSSQTQSPGLLHRFMDPIGPRLL
jgi:hypothetical protein